MKKGEELTKILPAPPNPEDPCLCNRPNRPNPPIESYPDPFPDPCPPIDPCPPPIDPYPPPVDPVPPEPDPCPPEPDPCPPEPDPCPPEPNPCPPEPNPCPPEPDPCPRPPGPYPRPPGPYPRPPGPYPRPPKPDPYPKPPDKPECIEDPQDCCGSCEPCPITRWICDNLFFVVCCVLVILVILILLLSCIIWWCRSPPAGIDCKPGECNFVVRIHRNKKYICAGVLLAEDFIITLASCFDGVKNPARNTSIIGGLTHTTTLKVDKHRGVLFKIDKIKRVTGYTEKGFQNDVVCIKLLQNITLTNLVGTVNPINSKKYPYAEKLTLFGYRKGVLQKRDVRIIHENECQAKLEKSYRFQGINNHLFCVDDDSGFRGERGAPVVDMTNRGGGVFPRVYGLVGKENDNLKKPLYITNLKPPTDFIQKCHGRSFRIGTVANNP